MRKLILILGIALGATTISSCVVHSHKKGHKELPPGQAKKIYGTKSAKPFAPGQNKKKGKKKKHHHLVPFSYNLRTEIF